MTTLRKYKLNANNSLKTLIIRDSNFSTYELLVLVR